MRIRTVFSHHHHVTLLDVFACFRPLGLATEFQTKKICASQTQAGRSSIAMMKPSSTRTPVVSVQYIVLSHPTVERYDPRSQPNLRCFLRYPLSKKKTIALGNSTDLLQLLMDVDGDQSGATLVLSECAFYVPGFFTTSSFSIFGQTSVNFLRRKLAASY